MVSGVNGTRIYPFFSLSCIFLQPLMARLINPKTLVTISDYHMVINTNIRMNRMVDDRQVGEYSGLGWRGTCDMIYLLTAIGLSPGGSSTVHIYTQRVHRTTQITTEQHK